MTRQPDTRLEGRCICGAPLSWHRDAKNRSVSCADAAPRDLHERLAAAVQQRQQRTVLPFEARS